MKRKIVVPTGYMGTGSSAVTDFISEIDGYCADHGSFEYVFFHCPNGIFDLEDKLLIGNNSLRSDEALHQFLGCMKDLYDKRNYWPGNYRSNISKDFNELCNAYINELTGIRLEKQFWYYQENPTFEMHLRLYFIRLIEIITFHLYKPKRKFLHNEMLLSYPSKEDFYTTTKKFVNDIFDRMGIQEKNVILDQLLLPHNLWRLNNYFGDEIRIIVVERDPRDIYLLNKYFWPQKNQEVPYPMDAKEFCKMYRSIRQSEKKYDDERIIRIYFEDLIYKYEETALKIYDLLEVPSKQHVRKMEFFKPDVSICNTQIFLNKETYKDEVTIIERELEEYLYSFPRGKGIVIDESHIF